jgi:hypothetical protein
MGAMRVNRLSMFAALAIVVAAFIVPLRAAQYDPIFDFIPLGGRSLLTEVFADGAPADQVTAILTGKPATRDEWLADLKARTGALRGLASLEDHELTTLADYLSFNMPLASDKIPADPASADWDEILPRDGRDLALRHCQSCHIITVTVTQDRTKEAWLGTMNKPSHVEIDTTQAEREALASYLVLNAGIPIDDVPEDLRAGGASY